MSCTTLFARGAAVLSLSLALSSLASLSSSCASVPQAAPGTCVVEARYLIGGKVAHVDGTAAKIPGLLADRNIAAMQNGRLLWKAGIAEIEGGHVEDGKLVLHGLWNVSSDPIAGGKVRVPLPIGERLFSYNEQCSIDEAALGAFAIIQMENEDALTSAAAS